MPGRVLIVDDEQSMCELLEADLTARGFTVSWRTEPEAAFTVLGGDEFDVVLTDLHMPAVNGIDLCARVVTNRPDLPVVVMTAFGNMDAAISAIRAGAYDFVAKPVENEVLALALERAVQHRQLQTRIRRLAAEREQDRRYPALEGESEVMMALFDQLARLGGAEVPALITGETGTGKQVVARALHEQSRGADRPFVVVNCAALPEALLESELFGHTRGAFTDAKTERQGLFVAADGGTLLLDEVGEIPLALQPKLLRALEEERIRPVGSDREHTVDVRVLSATNRDLEAAIEERSFRADLYYRINVVQIDLPPLRSRGMDVLLLARRFLTRAADRTGKAVTGFTTPVAERLLEYHWPGNVRELRNVCEHAVALTRHTEILLEDLPDRLRRCRGSRVLAAGRDPTEFRTLADVQRDYILHVLEAVGDNKSRAAAVLGLDRKTLYRKLERFGARSERGGD